MKFRTLKASEIECRVATVNSKGCSLLLYKDARADMNMLDETVGAENWQRKHEIINGNLFCNVGIKIDNEWVWKQDVGTESYTEKEKGQASDSFKRSCVNWGIGRELYTAPFIWISVGNVTIELKDGKAKTNDRFKVKLIDYDADRNISKLIITNDNTGKEVYSYGCKKVYQSKQEEPQADPVDEATAKAKVIAYVNRHNFSPEKITKICELYKVKSVNEMTLQQCNHYIKTLEAKGGNINE